MTQLAVRIRECEVIRERMDFNPEGWCYRCEMDGLMGLDIRERTLSVCHRAYARGRADRATLLRLEEAEVTHGL